MIVDRRLCQSYIFTLELGNNFGTLKIRNITHLRNKNKSYPKFTMVSDLRLNSTSNLLKPVFNKPAIRDFFIDNKWTDDELLRREWT